MADTAIALKFNKPTEKADPKPEALALGSLVGTWVNVNTATRDIVKIVLTNDGGSPRVHAYGACSPTPCDWGKYLVTVIDLHSRLEVSANWMFVPMSRVGTFSEGEDHVGEGLFNPVSRVVCIRGLNAYGAVFDGCYQLLLNWTMQGMVTAPGPMGFPLQMPSVAVKIA